MIELEKNIKKSLKKKEILLVSHVVLGYPNIKIGMQSVESMAAAGVDIVELQIPFSDPQADGPFFTKAQQNAVNTGITTEQCFYFAEEVCKKHPEINFIFMTYINLVFKYGISAFVKKAAKIGIKGIILPDLPIEESDEYFEACKSHKIAPILMFTPTTTKNRMKKINQKAKGFIYCQARVGTTGTHTTFGKEEVEYITRCKESTKLPLAMGFGIQKKEDVDFLKGKVDIAICCTQAVKELVKHAPQGMCDFLRSLR
jgi:tryptophan synthase alpha chain